MSVMYIIKIIRNLFFFKYINKLHRIKTSNNKTIDQGIKLAKKPESVLSNTNNNNKEMSTNDKGMKKTKKLVLFEIKKPSPKRKSMVPIREANT